MNVHRHVVLAAGCVVALAWASASLAASSGSWDPAFGQFGTVVLDKSASYSLAPGGIAASASGKIIAGYTRYAAFGQGTFAVARLLPNGSPDATFGNGGTSLVQVGLSNDVLQGVAVDSKGRILAAGTSRYLGFDVLVVVRLLASGALDTGYGSGGAQLIYPSPSIGWVFKGLAVDSQDRAHVLGDSTLPGAPFVARLTVQGQLDSSFGAGGMASLGGQGFRSVTGLAVDVLSRVIVSGTGPRLNFPSVLQFLVARLTSQGARDESFASNGTFSWAFLANAVNDEANAVTVDRLGRVLVGGYATNAGLKPSLAIVRLTQGGLMDPSFGTSGILIRTFGGDGAVVNGIGVASDDAIYVLGQYQSSSPSATFVLTAKATPDGQWDAEFNSGNDAAVYLDTNGVPVGALAAHGDGRIVFSHGFGGDGRSMRIVALVGASEKDSDGDGMPGFVETREGRDPNAKDNDLFASSRLFAMQQYRDFLGREGDPGGVDFYTALLDADASYRAAIIEAFFGSPEFGGTVAPVTRLYFAFFNRIPDYLGLQFQVNAYRTGTPLAVIANNFSLSPEFAATYGSLANSQYVALLYQNLLGRTPSQAEVDFHVARLASGVTRGEVMVGFSESPEYQALAFNAVYVTNMYAGMLRRAPEQAGFDYWVAYMAAGSSGQALIQGFLNAPEYRLRFVYPSPATPFVSFIAQSSTVVSEAQAAAAPFPVVFAVKLERRGYPGTFGVKVTACAGGTGCNAISGQDYAMEPGFSPAAPESRDIVFEDGESLRLVTANVLNDAIVDGPRLLTLSLSQPTATSVVGGPVSVSLLEAGPALDIDINGVPIPSPTGPAGATMCDFNPQTFQTGPYPGGGPGPCGSYQIPVGNCTTGMSGANTINKAYLYILENIEPGSPRLGNTMRMAIPRDAAMIFKFRTGPSGAFPEFLTSPFYRNLTIGYDEQVSRGPAAPHFVTISETRCDFDYAKTLTNGTLNGCYVTMSSSGSVLSKIWPAGSQPTPAADFPFCPLKPDTSYYMNIRYEDASLVNSRGILSCLAGACGAAIVFN